MKKKYYKLTNQNMQTYGRFQWKIGKWVKAKPKDGDYDKPLCSDTWLHCYESPLLTVLHNPIHACIKNPRLFEVKVGGESKFDDQLKCGFRRMRLVKEISLPEITITQEIAYGILCTKEVYIDKHWNKWADNWLSGKDRTAHAAANTAAYVADTVAYAANTVADTATHAAAYAAYAAIGTVADTAHAVAYVTHAAAHAAANAAYVAELNLIDISEKAMNY